MSDKDLISRETRSLHEYKSNTDLIHSYPAYDVHQNDEDEIDLRELWLIIKRRKGTIISLTLFVFILVALKTFLSTPIYRSSVTLQINPENSGKVLQYDVATQNSTPSNSFLMRDFYQTQYELLKSKALARDVIDELNLENDLRRPKLVKPFWKEEVDNGKNWLKSLFPTNESHEIESNEVKLGELPVELLFQKNLEVEPVDNSRIVMVHYYSKDPQLSTLIANTLGEKFIDMNLDRRVEAATYAEKFLKEQLVQAKSKLQESEVELVKYAKQKDIINTDDKQSLDSQKIIDLNKELTEAEKLRIEVEAKYNQVRNAKSISRIQDNVVIQTLKETKAKLQGEYQEKLGIYKPAFPSMVQLKQRIAEIEGQIQQEINSEVDALKADFLAAKQKEEEIRAKLSKQKDVFLSLKDNSIHYNTLSREVETNRELYEGLLQRLKEVGVAGSVGANNITILDKATVPFSKYKPNTKVNLALGGIIGLFLGTVVAFLLEFFNNTIKTSSEIENLLKVGVLGMVPSEKKAKKIPLLTATEPQSAVAEAFRSLRTNLLFSTSHGLPQSLLITSAMPSEGKSSIVSNLGITLAQSGKLVLIIDCDLRKPVQHKHFELDNSDGLSSYLTGQKTEEAITSPTAVDNLFVIPSGPIPPTPVELLSGHAFSELLEKAYERFDIVIIDSPPVIGISDALVLSQSAEATLFTVAYDQTKKNDIQETFKRLYNAKANIIGSIFTKVKQGSGGDYAYYYYYQDDQKRISSS
jgi:capsular exopolysaccharide synthesis family protein